MAHSVWQVAAAAAAGLIVILAGAGLSLYFGRRMRGHRDWLTAGASLPLVVVVFTQFATAVGGGVLIVVIAVTSLIFVLPGGLGSSPPARCATPGAASCSAA